MTISMNGLSQGFETTIIAPDFIAPCLDTTSMQGIAVEESNQSYFLLSIVEAFASACVDYGGLGYALTRISSTGDTLAHEVFMHPNITLDTFSFYQPIDLAIEGDSSIYVLGSEGNSINPIDPIFVAKFDTNGQLIWKQNYPYSYLKPDAIYVDGGSIFIGGRKNTSANIFEAAILQLDTNGNVEWTGSTQAGYGTATSKIVKRTNDYVLVGRQRQIGSANNNSIPFVVTFNPYSIGTSYPLTAPDNNYSYVDAIYSYDEQLIVGAHNSTLDRVELFKINNANLTLDTINCMPNPQMDRFSFRGLAQAADSNYAIVGERGYINSQNTNYGRTIFHERFDHQGVSQLFTEFAGSVDDVISNEQGEIVFTGYRINNDMPFLSSKSLLVKLDDQGLTPACTPHFVLFYEDHFTSDSLIDGGIINVINNSDGEATNFEWVVSGISNALNGHNVSFDAFGAGGWLTLTLIGCGQSYTDSVYVYANTSGLSSLSTSTINIFPNPIKDMLSITGYVGNLKIIGMDGREVDQLIISSNTILSAKSWKPGLYILLFEDESGVKKERVVKL